VLHINGLPVAATEFATDGCHRVYLIFTPEDRQTMLDCGYEEADIHPVSELPEAWDRTCPLRFISSADLTQRFVKQCERATVAYRPLDHS
jgi:hypothetical protein